MRRQQEKNFAFELRREGKSYREITHLLRIPKSTLATWFKDLSWSKSLTLQLAERYKVKNTNRLVEINKQRRLLTIQRDRASQVRARERFQELKNDLLFLSGVMLYWGEGDKKSRSVVRVSNSDPGIVRITSKFLRKRLKIKLEKLKGQILLYPDNNKDKALDFWSKVSGIPKKQFFKTQVILGRSNSKRRLIHGVCTLYVHDTLLKIQILEWINLYSRTLS